MADEGQRDQAAPWSGRAGVPQRGPTGADTGDWGGPGDQPEGRWWMPILIGLIGLALLGLLAVLIWLVTSRSPEPAVPPPSPSATGAPSRTAEPSTPPPTSPAPTTPAPTGSTVPMPPLAGLPLPEARALLDQLGIGYQLVFRGSDAPVGTVIETDPRAGEPVSPADQVTLVIAEPPATTPTIPAPTTSIPAPPGG